LAGSKHRSIAHLYRHFGVWSSLTHKKDHYVPRPDLLQSHLVDEHLQAESSRDWLNPAAIRMDLSKWMLTLALGAMLLLAPAHGAFLGCFNIAEWAPQTPSQSADKTVAACEAFCASKGMPIAMLVSGSARIHAACTAHQDRALMPHVVCSWFSLVRVRCESRQGEIH
jgi:hypothetical protein